MKILVLNTGSSTVKFSLVESAGEAALLDGLADWSASPAKLTLRRAGDAPHETPLNATTHGAAVEHVLHELTQLLGGARDVAAVGHRIVHGGPVYTASVRIDETVKRTIADLTEMAPLHNPVNLEGIVAAQKAWPDVPHVAVFDTAFHATIPAAVHTYAVPYAWASEWKLRRYGFHGLSHAYCADRAAKMLGRPLTLPSPPSNGGEGRVRGTGLRLVICHLGNGCSVTAVRDGRSVDTSMGFTPLDGLVMGTRSGAVDPGLLLHVLRHKGLSLDDLDRVLNRESGLLGVSGLTSDMRQLLEAARQGNERARLALDVFVHRLRQTIGAMVATLGGVDALVFTAGIGEHAAEVRAAACAGLGCFGVEIDPVANATCRPDADIAPPGAKCRALVIATREDLTIVRETVRVLGG
jgi:acetate kinase